MSQSGVARPESEQARLLSSHGVESLHQTLARNFPDDTLVLFDRDLRYFGADREGVDVAGGARSRLQGKTLYQAWPEAAARAIEPLYRAALVGEARTAEVPQGDRWLLVRACPVRDELGVIVAGLAISQDITDIKHAEQAVRGSRDLLQELIESSDDAIVAKDLEGRYILINSSTARMLGRSASEIVGRDERALFSPEDAQRSREADLRVLAQGEAETAEERFTVAGQRRPVLVTRSPLRNHGGKIIGVLAVARDITELRRLADRLARVSRMEAVARLAAGIAHDFNNLLTVVLGSAEILLDDLPSAYARRNDLEALKSAATQAALLTRQVLAYSRQQVLVPRLLDLTSFATRLEAACRRIVESQIELRVEVATPNGAVRIDAAQLEQAILNLVVNAREAMPRGGRLTISMHDVSIDEAFARGHPPMRPGRYATLVVRDTGIGMDEETQAHVFEPFFTTKPGRHGAGLGLATAYGIVKQSGGYIWAESAPGVGTTFTIHLPWCDPQATLVPSREPLDAPRGSGETVLVVDDEPAVRAVTKRLLQRSGYAVLEAAGGSEALHVLREYPGPVHLLLTDVIMPQMNGHELAARVRDQRPGTKMVYMSAYSPETITHEGLLDEGVAFVRKPYEGGQLLDTVRRTLDTKGDATAA